MELFIHQPVPVFFWNDKVILNNDQLIIFVGMDWNHQAATTNHCWPYLHGFLSLDMKEDCPAYCPSLKFSLCPLAYIGHQMQKKNTCIYLHKVIE